MRNVEAFGRPVHAPILKALVMLVASAWCILTLPLHFAVWAVNGRGFLTRRPTRITGRMLGGGGYDYSYDPPAWASLLSLIAFVVLLVIL
jgi:hypothetical protein